MDADVAETIGLGSLFCSSSAVDVAEIMDGDYLITMDAVEMTAVAGFGLYYCFAAVEMEVLLEIIAITVAVAANIVNIFQLSKSSQLLAGCLSKQKISMFFTSSHNIIQRISGRQNGNKRLY